MRPVSQGDEMLAAIRRDPEDASAYLVFADWLQDQGDPWGTWIATQIAGEQEGRHRYQAMAFLEAQRARVLGELAPYCQPMEPFQAAELSAFIGRTDRGPVDVRWERGFIRSLRIAVDATPWPICDDVLGQRISVARPAYLLDELTIGTVGADDGMGAAKIQHVLQGIGFPLRALFVGDLGVELQLGSLDPRLLGPILAGLEQLDIRCLDPDLHAYPPLPELQHLGVHQRALTKPSLAALDRFTAVESLELTALEPIQGSADLALSLSSLGSTLSALSVSLLVEEAAVELVDAVAGHGTFPALQEMKLGCFSIRRGLVDALRRHADGLARIDRIVIEGAVKDDSIEEELEALGLDILRVQVDPAELFERFDLD